MRRRATGRRQVQVTLYRWAGRRFGVRIDSHCRECDATVRVIQDVIKTCPSGDLVDFQIRNWLDHFFECLLRGGWHAPVVLVNGRLLSQGVIPTAREVAAAIDDATSAAGPTGVG